jgi:RNA polymerase sigma-70 factor (ECF subfamily)
MPEKRQTVFRLCFIQEFTYKDAAEVLNVTVKTVENHMGLALKELRGKLEGFR